MPLQETRDLLTALVGFDTISAKSNLPLIAYVERYLASLGIAATRVPDATGTKANLFATIGPADRPGYIFSGHTDVVPVEGQSWTNDPFTLTERQQRLYGRGAVDMKGFVACVLAKVPAMIAAGLQRPIHIALSHDEEIGCVGVRSMIEVMRHWPVRPAGCIVGEPTGMQVVVAHKGKQSFRVEVVGRTAHSSLAPFACNAVEYAARLIVFIGAIGERLKQQEQQDTMFDVAHSTAHTGVIRGGSQLNIVPDSCLFDFEFRTLPVTSTDALVEEVKAHARDVLLPKMREIAPEANIRFHPISAFPGLDTAPDATLVSQARNWAERNACSKVAYGTEAGLFAERLGVPTIVCGPGHITEAHKADEFIELSELSRCERFIDRVIEHCQRPV